MDINNNSFKFIKTIGKINKIYLIYNKKCFILF